ncbi:MAG: hypothetical protein IAX21_07185 [Candidatus Bathyarchaeota archaeon]|nr:MAG: hypothetical protein IAX21_07185 [Candidatus Bathyarchaeota archaeon]
MENPNINVELLSRFGFRFEKGNTHAARSMMLQELQSLLSCVHNPSASKSDYRRAIIEENCLGKRSEKSRKITSMHLGFLYALDPEVTIFRVLRYFWDRDVKGRPLLALLSAYSRDGLVRTSAPLVLPLVEGETFRRDALEEYIYKQYPNRFSEASLKSVVRNLAATWTKSGHLVEKNGKKIRSKALATPGLVSFALLLGYLVGARGEALFTTEFAKLLDCSPARSIELAEEASRRGWIVFKRIGKVMEVQFANLLTAQEREWIYEQN